jgi:uncharacterized membrane protein YccC
MFAVGAGLPGASAGEAAVRLSLSLSGSLLALGGVELHRLVLSRRHPLGPRTASPGQQLSRRETVRSAILLGMISALGFWIGLALGLPRDFWVVLTIIVSVRPSLSLTVSFTSMMAGGTIIGALIAAAITLETSDAYVLLPLLFAFAVLMLASRGVNFGLVQVFLTPFIIILLNILYPGEWYLAFYRILEVGIGVVLAIIAVYLLSVRRRSNTNERAGIMSPSFLRSRCGSLVRSDERRRRRQLLGFVHRLSTNASCDSKSGNQANRSDGCKSHRPHLSI